MKFLKSELIKSKHGFFTRNGGTSKGSYESLNVNLASNDERANIDENLSRIASAFSIDPQNVFMLKQTHSNHVFYLEGNYCTQHLEGDALITAQKGMLIGVKTADCVPILLETEDLKFTAAIHAGWRGSLGGVIDNTISMLKDLSDSPIKAAIGPCIRDYSYEVDQAFYQTFCNELTPKLCDSFFHLKTDNKYLFDIAGFCTHKLQQLGVVTIDDLEIDTVTNPQDFFSFRRKSILNEPAYGCQFSGIMIP